MNVWYVANLAAFFLLATGLVVAAFVCGMEHRPVYVVARFASWAMVALYIAILQWRYGIPKTGAPDD